MKSKFSLLTLCIAGLVQPLLAVDVWITGPTTASHNVTYSIGAGASGDSASLSLSLLRNGSTVGSSSGSFYITCGTSDAAAGPQTVAYYAEAWDWEHYESASIWHYVTISAPANQAPIAVCDYAQGSVPQGATLFAGGWAADNEMGAPITRVDVLVDNVDVADVTLGGDRQDVANAYGRSDFRYSGWGINLPTGSFSLGTHTLEFKAWDNQGASTVFGYGSRTFTVTDGTPSISLDSPTAQTISLGSSLTLTTHATDPSGDIVTHNLDIQRPDGTWNWQGGFAYGEPYMGGPVGTASDSLRSAQFTFNIVGVWYVRGYVNDALNHNLHSATVAITVVDNTAPSVPVGLSATSVTYNSFTLTWSASTDNVGVTAYEVFKNGTSLGTTASTSLAVSGLSPSTTYGMTVRARDAAGNWSAQSSTLNVTTAADTEAPTVPTGLASSSITTSSFTLSWSPSSDNVGVTAYEVFKNGASLGTTAATSLAVSGLNPGTTYGMTVRARDAAGNWSTQSSTLNVTTSADTTAPSVPTGLASSSLTCTSFTLTWTASTDNVAVTGYEVYKDGVSQGTTASTSFALSGLSPSNVYAMKVRARDAAGNWSAQSSALNVSTPADTTAPTVPVGLSSSSVSVTSFTLSWTASTDNVAVTAYEVFKNSASLGTTATTSLVVSGLTPNTTYLMTVRARDAAGNWSAQSSQLSVPTPPDTLAPSIPTGLAASSVTISSFTLTWSASSDNVAVTAYELFRDGASLGTTGSLSYPLTGLPAAHTVSMTVRARDAAGNWSAQSTVLSVPTGDGDADGDGLTNWQEYLLGTNPATTTQSVSPSDSRLLLQVNLTR